MITHLCISGLALIDELDVEFSPGFNVITGETGAGKTILIRALNCLMGNRLTSELVRSGRDAATVTGRFEVAENHGVKSALNELGIVFAGEVVLRRKLCSSGKSNAWINDVPVTLTTLKEVSKHLIDIFSQHENQRLMDTASHTHYVDRLGRLSNREVHEAAQRVFEAYQAIQKTLESLGDLEKNRDYISYRFSELSQFNPKREEFDELTETVKRRESLAAEQESLSQVASIIDEDPGLLCLLKELVKRLSKIPLLGSHEEKIRAMVADIESLSFQIGQSGEDVGNLEADQERLFAYQDLMRKNSARDIEELMLQLENLSLQMKLLEDSTQTIAAQIRELEKRCVAWKREAEKLSKERKKYGESIATKIASELNDLGMAGAHFEIQWQSVASAVSDVVLEKHWKNMGMLQQVSKNGLERAEFLLGANTGESAHPLSKIASGGELSRIMLALKNILASGADMCVLVFDEIDTGISGRIANVVGQKIQALSNEHQVLCISHLPQVSVYADAHLLVKKWVKSGRMESVIERLSPIESQREIARMLSGEKVSQPGLENAKALIDLARKTRKKKKNSPSLSV